MTNELQQAQAQAAALRLGVNEAVMLLDYHGIPVPQSTRQCLVVHGGAHYAGEALLHELTMLRDALVEIHHAADAPGDDIRFIVDKALRSEKGEA